MRYWLPTEFWNRILHIDVGTVVQLIGLFGFAVILAFGPLLWLPAIIAIIAGGLLLLRYPWLIWVVMGLALPWTSGVRIGVASVTDIILLLAITLWFVDAVRHEYVRIHMSQPAIAALLYCVALYLSSFNAVDSRAAMLEIIKWLQFTVILLILPSMLHPQHHVPWVVGALFAGATTQALLGIYQFTFMIGPEWYILNDRYMRAYGSFGQPNPFGGYLGLTLPVTMSVLNWFSVRPLRKRRLNWRDITGWTIARTVVPIVSTGLWVSWSRGAWLGAVAAIAVVMWMSSTRFVRIITAVVALIILVIGATAPLMRLIPPDVLNRFAEIPMQFGLGASLDAEVTDANFAVLERMAFWVAALRMWEYAPWFGVGPANFDAVYATFAIPRWEMSLGHAHNIYLNVLAETGIVGFVAFIWLWGSVISLAYTSYQESRRINRWQAALSVGVLGVVAHLAIHSLFDNLFVQGMFLHLSLWIAILLSLHAAHRAAMPQEPLHRAKEI